MADKKKKTLADYDAEIEKAKERKKKADARVKELEAKKRKAEQEHRGEVNVQILQELEEWRKTLQKEYTWDELPELFRTWAEKNRRKREQEKSGSVPHPMTTFGNRGADTQD